MSEINSTDTEKSNLNKSRNSYTALGLTDNITKFVHIFFDENEAYFHANEYTITSDNIAKKFEMTFNSEKLIVLSDDYIVDYGKYTVDSYNGNLFFIWKRQKDNNWKIHLDLCMF